MCYYDYDGYGVFDGRVGDWVALACFEGWAAVALMASFFFCRLTRRVVL